MMSKQKTSAIMLRNAALLGVVIATFAAAPAMAQPTPQNGANEGRIHSSDAADDVGSYDSLRPPGTPKGYVLIEGDILLPEEVLLTNSYNPGSAWPEGIIPFSFDPALTESNKVAMRQAMDLLIGSAADVQFIYRTNEPDYIYVTISEISGVSYSDNVGKKPNGGQQVVAINSSSWDTPYVIAHELLHALGFYHEQSRPDRDQYVTIEWDNVEDDASSRYQFRLADGSDTLDTPYDYTSIMHYGPCSFTKCTSCSSSNASCRTITTLNPAFQSIIGNRSKFGLYDIEDLRRVYGDGVAHYADSSGLISVVGTLAQPYSDMNLGIALSLNATVWGHGSWNNVRAIPTPVTLRAHGGNLILH